MKEELNKCYRTLALILLVVLLLAITSVALRYKEHGNEPCCERCPLRPRLDERESRLVSVEDSVHYYEDGL
ncbi:MAG: hypothetical protein SPL28_06455 [Bacteroidales bacterium]|nr:hypothetical protein [Bacteroidales bacterium]